MKKRTKLIIGLVVACAGSCIFAACSADNSPYNEFHEKGASVSVHYDPNGGQFNSTEFVTLTDVYPLAQAQKGVVLLEPGIEERGDADVRSLSTISRSGYFLAGWYRERSLRTDGNGNALDEDGNLCSESGKAQGYTYAGRWDFEHNEVFQVGSDWEYVEGEYALTLYAAWIPNFSYAFYEETENGWSQYGTYTFNPILTAEYKTMSLPALDEEGVAMDYGSVFAQAAGKTFVAAYADAEKTQACEGTFTHLGEIDYEHGVSVNGITACYTTWRDGVWYNIYQVSQFIEHSDINGCYNIYADLDFTDETWYTGFSRNTFTGQIIGNGHTFRNIGITQTDVTQTYGGLFGRISAEAVFKDISFENVSYTLKAGSRINPSSFGLFAGEISNDATMENVSVSGTFYIGSNLYRPASGFNSYNIGILSGNLVKNSIVYDIACELYEDTRQGNTFELDETTGEITISLL